VILGDRREELLNAKVISVVPDIAAEVLSPSETTRMIHRKLKQYFAAGVKEVWLIDPDSQEVEVWTGPALPDRALVAGKNLIFFTAGFRPAARRPLRLDLRNRPGPPSHPTRVRAGLIRLQIHRFRATERS